MDMFWPVHVECTGSSLLLGLEPYVAVSRLLISIWLPLAQSKNSLAI